MNRDIRILSLYKRHYLNHSTKDNSMNCQYFCWGYFDGIQITNCADIIEKQKSNPLFIKKTESPISDIWFTLTNLSQSASGIYGSQDIGIFRCKDATSTDNNTDSFWEEENTYPFFSVAFLQLNNKQLYESLQDKIEHTEQIAKNPEEASCLIRVYATFDNADLIVLIQGNNLILQKSIIQEIRELPEVNDLYSISGVHKDYLSFFSKNKHVFPETWHNRKCFINESIQQVQLDFATSGDKNISTYLTHEFRELNLPLDTSCEYIYHVYEHTHFLVTFKQLSVQLFLTLLSFLCSDIHQNALWGKIIYHVEIQIILNPTLKDFTRSIDYTQKLALSTNPNPSPSDSPENDRTNTWKSWCLKKLEKYKNAQTKALLNEDISLYSYYHALLKTLNTLSQYENFNISKSVFYLIYPALSLFDNLLDAALSTADNADNFAKKHHYFEIKKSIRQFIDAVNSIIYHVIHTDQMFFLLPGQSGTTFSAPLKLCLMYAWFNHQVIHILNDEKGTYKYQCLLVPVIESSPWTSLISFNLQPGSRLIRIRLSQRSLYMPRGMFIILSHEIAHYVGKESRCRTVRLECLIRTLSDIIAESVISMEYDYGIDRKIITSFRKTSLACLKKGIYRYFSDYFKKIKNTEYHASIIQTSLITLCQDLFEDKTGLLTSLIYCIPDDLLEQINKGDASLLKNVIYAQNFFDTHRKRIWNYSVVEKLVTDLLKTYQEVFSDVASYVLLDYTIDEFSEAFNISEGIKITQKSLRQKLREKIILNLSNHNDELIDNTENNKQQYDTTKTSDSIFLEPHFDMPYEQLYNYDSTQFYLYAYAKKCFLALKRSTNIKDLEEIREIFRIFNGSNQCSCKIIYSFVMNKIFNYEKNIEKDVRKQLK